MGGWGRGWMGGLRKLKKDMGPLLQSRLPKTGLHGRRHKGKETGNRERGAREEEGGFPFPRSTRVSRASYFPLI